MSFFNVASSGTMAAGSVIETMQNGFTAAQTAYNHGKTSSLTSLTAVANVEPLAIIDTDSMNSEFIGPVLQCAHNIFAAQYIQAISLLGNVGKINVIKTLDRLNPNRKPDQSGFIDHIVKTMVTESIHGKQDITVFGFTANNTEVKLPSFGLEAKDNEEKEEKSKQPISATKSVSTITELSNLAVGKLIEVTLRDQGFEMTVPLAIRLIPNELPLEAMLKLLSLNGFDRSFNERYWKWRAGRISFISDLILMRDLVKEDKKAMMQDKNGVLSEIINRSKNNKLAGFFSKSASLNEAANIIVISEETANQLKLRHNINIENFKDRQRIFEGSSAMIIVKLDREWERFTFYISNNPLGSSINKNELKNNSGKSSGMDIAEMMSILNKANQTSLF